MRLGPLYLHSIQELYKKKKEINNIISNTDDIEFE
jgi:hypothetical protein